MPNYKTMYTTLFNSVTDAIELLKQAQIQAEEIFIESKKDSNEPFQSDVLQDSPSNLKKHQGLKP